MCAIRYLNNDSCVPLIMHGDVGCGKSSLIAKAMERCCEWLVDVPLVVRSVPFPPHSFSFMPTEMCNIINKCSIWKSSSERLWIASPISVMNRFVGLTPGSSTTEQVLRSIAEQCCALFGEHRAEAAKVKFYCCRLLYIKNI